MIRAFYCALLALFYDGAPVCSGDGARRTGKRSIVNQFYLRRAFSARDVLQRRTQQVSRVK